MDTQDFQYVLPERFYKGDDRWYRIEGSEYPGVTTILSRTKQYPPALARWMKSRTPEELEELEQKKQEGAARGTVLHGMVERYFTDGTPGEGPYWDSIWPIVRRVQRVHLMESAVAHPLGFAGTLDLLCDIDDEVTLVDWKTATKSKPEDWLTDYKQQACAYCAALRLKYGQIPKRALIGIAIAGEPAQEVLLPEKKLRKVWPDFKRRVRLYKTMRGLA